ncbi:MAG: hypothetical protein U1F76_31775 [Candidatus Competibacteraceae bacterium]
MIDINPDQIHGLLGGTDDPARRQTASDRSRQSKADEDCHSSYRRDWKQDYSAVIEVSISSTPRGLTDPPNELIR